MATKNTSKAKPAAAKKPAAKAKDLPAKKDAKGGYMKRAKRMEVES